MSGKPKITEHSLRYVISQSHSVGEAAEKAGVSRWTIRRLSLRWMIDLATAFGRPAPVTDGKRTPSDSVASPKPIAEPIGWQPTGDERDIRVLRPSDFTGPFRGDVRDGAPRVIVHRSFHPNSYGVVKYKR